MSSNKASGNGGVKSWFMKGVDRPEAPHAGEGADHKHSWWQVMCLTGVDYFSTLGYQPGIGDQPSTTAINPHPKFRDRESNASRLAYEAKGGNQHHFPAKSGTSESNREPPAPKAGVLPFAPLPGLSFLSQNGRI